MQLSIVNKYTLSGIALGLAFPLVAWSLEIFLSGLTLSPATLVLIHQNNSIHYIVNTAPVVLGAVFYFLGRANQRTLNRNDFSSLIQLSLVKKEQKRLSDLIRLRVATNKIQKVSENIENVQKIETIEKNILKIVSHALKVERVSIWYYKDDKNSIVAKVLYKQNSVAKYEDIYESGMTFSYKDYPDYFSALTKETTIVADDAISDIRTREFKDNYLKPLGISSKLDVAIRLHNKSIGIICLEHTGEMRQWDLYEQDFATSASSSLALILETYERVKSETRLNTILSTMVDGLITMDDMGTVESFNPSSETIFGYSAKEVIGQNIKMLIPPHFSDNHDQYLKNYRDTGEIKILGKTGREVEGKKKCGMVFPLAVSISEMHIGGVRKFSSVIRDITEVKLAQAETKRIADELTQLVDTANAPIFGIDSSGFVNEWNQMAAQITGYEKAEVLGKDLVAEFITDEHKEPVKEVLDNALRGEDTANYEFPLFTKDERRLDVLLNATTRRDVDGNIIGVIGVGQDITALRDKESALYQSQKMEAVGQLTGGIAHDFNNLLSVISGNLRFLKQDIGETSNDINELFEDAMSAADDGAELTQRLLSFSRNRALEPELNNVNETMEKLVRFLSRTLVDNIELIVDLPNDVLFIKVDRFQLENALLNLTINARDAMPEGGTITINAIQYHHSDNDNSDRFILAEGDYININVTDTGSGINSEDLEHVYEPFFTTKDIGKGTGLGLSMVHGFLQQSQGNCNISSHLGEGTTVSMYFPEVAEIKVIEKANENEALSLRGSEVILVVEDESRVRRVTLRDLKKLGYKTLEAENADMAISIIETGEHIDLLFSDVLMPGNIDGQMLGVWTEENHPKIKVVLTSGFSKGKTDAAKDKEHPFPLIRKPYSIDNLAKQIRTTLLK
ncbi:MAG: PAS domain S-box protein [Gammaproteobacteria bacterium]|nr:PAS domain S-box protein [Gammaproteobacteria bacterium]